jgi:hypothetical protein
MVPCHGEGHVKAEGEGQRAADCAGQRRAEQTCVAVVGEQREAVRCGELR